MESKREMVWYEVDGELIVSMRTRDAEVIWEKLVSHHKGDMVIVNRLYRGYMDMTKKKIHLYGRNDL